MVLKWCLVTLRGGVSEPLQPAVGELVYRVPSHLNKIIVL